MKIACIGWGSLIWNSRNLKIHQKWFEDGPILPIEFARESDNGRITLVITTGAKPTRTLWALMSVDSLDEAISSLQEREGIKDKNKDILIGSTRKQDDSKNETEKAIKTWLNSNDLDAAIWTTLPPKIGKDERIPSLDEVIQHLNKLGYEDRLIAEEYVRKAPKQIDTEYRRLIEIKLGWTFKMA